MQVGQQQQQQYPAAPIPEPCSSTRALFHAAIAQEAANTLPRACDSYAAAQALQSASCQTTFCSHRRLRHPSQVAHQLDLGCLAMHWQQCAVAESPCSKDAEQLTAEQQGIQGQQHGLPTLRFPCCSSLPVD
ncbi:hypothetical protein OEZ86_010151 [Tetradesmus obliquus]|nr:hypothetical protein OEZ86_010151 [Tetradesmus obliquus]